MRRLVPAYVCMLLLGMCQAASGVPSATRARPTLEITYVANEGFLLAAGGKKVLIDALFREGVEGYETLPPEKREQLETARSPFDSVDLVLVSHYHADHFDPAAVARYLTYNLRAVLVSSSQVVRQVQEQFEPDSRVRERLRAVKVEGNGRLKLTVAGIGLEMQRVSHGRSADIQNFAHLVTLGGWRLVHLGDATAGEEEFKRLRWDREKIDVAFLPFWYLTDPEGQKLVKRYVRARQIVAMHIPPAEREKLSAQIRAVFPDAVIFTQPLETKTFP